MINNVIISFAVFCVLWTPVWAQQQGDQQPPSGQAPQTQQPTERPNRQRPLFLSGKVILADGRAPGMLPIYE